MCVVGEKLLFFFAKYIDDGRDSGAQMERKDLHWIDFQKRSTEVLQPTSLRLLDDVA